MGCDMLEKCVYACLHTPAYISVSDQFIVLYKLIPFLNIHTCLVIATGEISPSINTAVVQLM
uniref:Uncharacterized protein n=1 Tax=Anguilla anguilla TaxID=7936 RepID=A0A0E9VYH4_ANGAN